MFVQQTMVRELISSTFVFQNHFDNGIEMTARASRSHTMRVAHILDRAHEEDFRCAMNLKSILNA